MALTPDFSTFIGREAALAGVAFKAGVVAQVSFAGVVGKTIGPYQFHVVMPFVPPGDQAINLTVDGMPNTQNLSIVIGR